MSTASESREMKHQKGEEKRKAEGDLMPSERKKLRIKKLLLLKQGREPRGHF